MNLNTPMAAARAPGATPSPAQRSRSLAGALLGAAAIWTGSLLAGSEASWLAVVAFIAAGLGWALMAWAPQAHQPDETHSNPYHPMSADSASQDQARIATLLTRQVVPVWNRNVDGARHHAEQSMNALVNSFSVISQHLDHAIGSSPGAASLDGESVDLLIARHQSDIDALLAHTRQIAHLKDDMHQGLVELGTTLTEMQGLTREVQTISRATHLLALNASAEASRAHGDQASAAGFAVVAREVRTLASQSRDAGMAMGRRVQAMHDRIEALSHKAARLDTDEDELLLQAEQDARRLVRSLLQGIVDVSRSQRTLHEAGAQVQGEIERILVGLQSQDRLNQMLGSVTDDMVRLQKWLEGQEDSAARSATLWLERLEASYTMEEMRSTLHDTVAVEKESSVEFF